MNDNRTNHDLVREEILLNPELKVKYILAREKVRLEMMLETLREQVLEEKSRKTILGQITKITNRVAQIYL